MRSIVPASFSALALATAAQAQPFVAVNISPSPDSLFAFDATNPGATLGTPIPLAGNFIRGFDLDTPTHGWYVCTADISGSPIGFFEYDNGVSTLIGPMPQENSAAGGLSLNEDNSFLYYVIEDPSGASAEDQLWTVSFSGVFTLIGNITGVPHATPVFNGIAVDADGTIYGIETNTDVLYTIDPVTAAATAVGPLNAINGAIGGLDFGPDGRLFGILNSRDLHEIDTTSGNATFLGEVAFGSSALSWADPAPARCIADLSGSSDPNDPAYGVPDSELDASDFFYFLDQFAAGNLTAADLSGSTDPNDPGYGDPDGILDAADFFYFLDEFAAGCP